MVQQQVTEQRPTGQAPDPIELEVQQEMAAFQEEMGGGAVDPRAIQNDPSVPVGTEVKVAEGAGGEASWRKPNSMVRMGDTPLPERTPVYHRFRPALDGSEGGEISMVATAALFQNLAKTDEMRGADGVLRRVRVYSRSPWADAPVMAPPNGPECEICTMVRAAYGNAPYKTRNYAHWRAHMDAFHPTELAAFLDEETNRRASEQLEVQKQIAQSNAQSAQAMAAFLDRFGNGVGIAPVGDAGDREAPEAAATPPAVPAGQDDDLAAAEVAVPPGTCPFCGQSDLKNVSAHVRMKRRHGDPEHEE